MPTQSTLETRLQHHLQSWKHCEACRLCETRDEVALFRLFGTDQVYVFGSIRPIDVVLVGEAPGESENTTGRPFTGPAGQRLNKLLRSVFAELATLGKPVPSIAITNINACFPQTPDGDIRPPSKDEAKACQPRLLEFLEIVQPKLVVMLGVVTKRYFPKGVTFARKHPYIRETLELMHPSGIIRMDSAKQPTAEARWCLNLRLAIERLEK